MRILHVSSWFQPQLGYSEYHLPRTQQKLGHEVAVATSDRYYPFPDYESSVSSILGQRVVGEDKREEYGVLTYRLPVWFEYRYRLLLRGLSNVLQQFKPDVVHVHEAFTFTTIQSAIYSRQLGCTLVVASSMEKEVFYPQTWQRRLYYDAFVRIAAPILRRNVDVFTAVGSGAKDILVKSLALNASDVRIVPLGADADRFRFDEKARHQVRQELGLNAERVLVIYAGKLVPNKDVHVLMEAIGRLGQDQTHISLLLVGNGTAEYKARLRSLATTSQAAIIFHDVVPNSDLPRFFSAADIGVWPSESSNAAIEAGLVGLPIVVSETQATRHYVAGENGMTFPRGDVDALADRLRQLISDFEMRKKMGSNARSYIEQNMTWEAVAKRYLAWYSDPIAQ